LKSNYEALTLAQEELRMADEDSKLALSTTDCRLREIHAHYARQHLERAKLLLLVSNPGCSLLTGLIRSGS